MANCVLRLSCARVAKVVLSMELHEPGMLPSYPTGPSIPRHKPLEACSTPCSREVAAQSLVCHRESVLSSGRCESTELPAEAAELVGQVQFILVVAAHAYLDDYITEM